MSTSLSASLYYDPEHFCLNCQGSGVIQLNKQNIFCMECLGKGDRLTSNPVIERDIRNVMWRHFGQYFIVAKFEVYGVEGGKNYYLYHDWSWRTDPDFEGVGRHFPDKKSAMDFLLNSIN